MSIIPAGLVLKASLTAAKLSVKAPQILFAGGVAGMIGTTVLASRATLKLGDALDEHKRLIDLVGEASDLPEEKYSSQDAQRDKIVIYSRTVIKICKLYGPAVLVGAASIAALAGSHHILTERVAGVTAAFTALDQGFKRYRARVVEDRGPEKDFEYLHGVEKVTVEKVDPESGKAKKTQEKKATASVSPYARIFGYDNVNHHERPEINITFLRGIQRMANDKLQAQGYLFLSDVYKDLGFPDNKAARVVGWLWEPKPGEGDGFVDLGLFSKSDDFVVHEYLIGQNGEIWLDFNVDGVILDKF